jgi:hypothetical protein
MVATHLMTFRSPGSVVCEFRQAMSRRIMLAHSAWVAWTVPSRAK